MANEVQTQEACECKHHSAMHCALKVTKVVLKAASVAAAFCMVSELGKIRHHIKKIEKTMRHEK